MAIAFSNETIRVAYTVGNDGQPSSPCRNPLCRAQTPPERPKQGEGNPVSFADKPRSVPAQARFELPLPKVFRRLKQPANALSDKVGGRFQSLFLGLFKETNSVSGGRKYRGLIV
jgi:hypothetical protein